MPSNEAVELPVAAANGDNNEYLPDSSGFGFTPTLRIGPTATTLPANNQLPPGFSVCVIGASRGIGAHIPLAYAIAGASTFILTATSSSGLTAITREIKTIAPSANVIGVACDVSSDTDMASLAEIIRNQVPSARLDAVVVNAAYYGDLVVDITAGSTSEWKRCLDVNAGGTYLAAHYLVPLLMATEDGAKVFLGISSLGAWVTEGLVAHLAYCVSKLAQVRIVEHLAEQYGGKGLCALSIHPGCVDTDMAKAAPKQFEKYLVDEPGLCGAFCVWITKNKLTWLNGRFVSATWDADELLAAKDRILRKDLLKARLAVN